MNRTKVKILADSINGQNRITTFEVRYPRIIHGEVMTHRVFSRNASSSRAVPFEKMIKEVMDNPFIPIAWQRRHKGMQGAEYLDPEVEYKLSDFLEIFAKMVGDKSRAVLDNLVIDAGLDESKTLEGWWLYCRDLAIQASIVMSAFGVTKQLCNRLLEPFSYITVIITATEFDNFFELRCPKYTDTLKFYYKSKKDFNSVERYEVLKNDINDKRTELDWLKINESKAEIHIQQLAELMWDARKESTPKILESGEWHMPYADIIDTVEIHQLIMEDLSTQEHIEDYDAYLDAEQYKYELKVVTAMCARVSYLNHEGSTDYRKDIKLHDNLLEDKHASPFEHCAECKGNNLQYANFKGWQSYRNVLKLIL